MKINDHFEVRYIDTDPDTGLFIRDLPIAITMSSQNAAWIMNALVEFNTCDEQPDRKFYIKPVKDIKLPES